jgi:hypothetical protein
MKKEGVYLRNNSGAVDLLPTGVTSYLESSETSKQAKTSQPSVCLKTDTRVMPLVCGLVCDTIQEQVCLQSARCHLKMMQRDMDSLTKTTENTDGTTD